MRKFSLFIVFAMLIMAISPILSVLSEEPEESEYAFFDSFEKRFTDLPKQWSYFGTGSLGTVQMDTKKASDGRISIKLTDQSTTSYVGIQSTPIPVTPGIRYNLSTDLLSYSGVCSVYFRFFDEKKQIVTDRLREITATNSWITAEISEFAPKNAVNAIIILYISAINVGEVNFDNVRVTIGEASTILAHPPIQTESVTSKLVTPSENKLIYSPYNEMGDTFSDFSYAGFYSGEVDLPVTDKLTIAATVDPSEDQNTDDTERLQNVIDSVASKVPEKQMQVIKLKEGRYNINSKGLFLKSGVVLSGSGQGPNGTVLYAKDPKQYTAISVAGTPSRRISIKANITDDYVKAGSNIIHISEDDIKNFKEGDLITVYHPSTNEWIHGVEMYDMKDINGNDSSWKKDEVDMPTERTIKAINGTEITLDFPMFVPLNKAYSQAYIYVTDDSSKVENFGVENLRLESYYNGDAKDEQHSNYAINITYAKNGFVRNISAKYFVVSAVRCSRGSKQITVQNCSSLQPVSQIIGSRRYIFACAYDAQQILFADCYSYDGRHDYTASYNGTGPIVFLDSVADMSNQSSEPHGLWTTGMLYDNIYHTQPGGLGFMAFPNTGVLGIPLAHGWCTAGSIAWNSLTTTLIAHKPPLTYQNFMIGVFGRFLDASSLSVKRKNISDHMFGGYRTSLVSKGDEITFATKDTTPFTGDAYKEAEENPVEPRSLFKAQLAQRINGDFKNARPNAPILLSPKSDGTILTNQVTINGIYQLGAEKVTIYIDNNPYETVLDEKTNTFQLSVSLEEGYHKIYATQTVQGLEGTKNADRFIKVGNADNHENPPYMQSIYDREKTALILRDSRMTFDQYQNTVSSTKADGKIKIIVDGNTIESDVAPIMSNDRILVPIRSIFEGLGAKVTYNEQTQTATAIRDEDIVVLAVGSDIASVNGVEKKLDVSAQTINGRIFVPVRFVAESFGVNSVDWLEKLKIVYIDANRIIYEPQHNIPNALTVYSITQSGDDGADNTIKNSLDGKLSTRWAVAETEEREAFGIYDLKSVKTLSELYLAFMSGATRAYTFSLEISVDGKKYVRILDHQKSSGKTNEMEAYSLDGVDARYIKIIGHGNNENKWNSITEILFTEKK